MDRWQKWKSRTGRWLAAVALVAAAFALLSPGARWWWPLDLLSPFQLQYLAALLVCGPGLILCGRWRAGLLALAATLLPLARVAPSPAPPPEPTLAAEFVRTRVLSFNLLSSNRKHVDVLRWVREQAPDVAVFPETTLEWARQLEQLGDILPYSVMRPREDNFGLAVMSRLPLRMDETCGGASPDDDLSIRVVVERSGRLLTIYGLHPPPPAGSRASAERNLFLRQLAEANTDPHQPVVLAGDFNATPWCHGMTPLHKTGFRDARGKKFPAPTWRPGLALAPVSIPIDHVMIKGPVQARKFRTGPDLGSDHRPIVADLLW